MIHIRKLFICLFFGAIFLSMTKTYADSSQIKYNPQPDWGILAFPALGNYNLVQFYMNWGEDYKAAVAETAKLGATRALIAKTWQEIEPSRGKINIEDLQNNINLVQKYGEGVFFGLQLINTNKRQVPEDLQNISWDSPEMLQRARVIIDRTIPLLPHEKLSYFSFGNEVDVYFEKYPEEIIAYGLLYKNISEYIHSRYPNIKIGVTTTFDGFRENRKRIIDQINQNTDVLIFTYYATHNFKALPPDSPQNDIPEMIHYASGKPIILQEVGYPSATGAGSSQEAQAEFIRQFFSVWKRNRAEIPYINIFMQTDFGVRICDNLTSYYNSQAQKDLFSDNICTLGLKDSYGKPKLAWKVLSEEITPIIRNAQ